MRIANVAFIPSAYIPTRLIFRPCGFFTMIADVDGDERSLDAESLGSSNGYARDDAPLGYFI